MGGFSIAGNPASFHLVALPASTYGLQGHCTCLHQAVKRKAGGGSDVVFYEEDWNWGTAVHSHLIGQNLVMWSIPLKGKLGHRV